jgi:hypothetical protein
MALLRLRQGLAEDAFPLVTKAVEHGTARAALALYARGIAQEMSGDVRSAYSDLRLAAVADPQWSVPAKELTRYRVVSR